MHARTCRPVRSAWIVVCLLAAVAGLATDAAGQLVYDLNFDSSAATAALIPDQSGNGFDFDNVTENEVPLNFQFVPNDLLLNPFDQVLDVGATGNGAISQDIQMFDEADISDAGGFTFELYVRRTSQAPAGQPENIWNPAGTHSLEINANGDLELAIRGVAGTQKVANTVLPIGEWHHVAGVYTVENPIDPDVCEGNPDPFCPFQNPIINAPDVFAQLYIDGVLQDPDNALEPDTFSFGNLCAGGFAGSCIRTADEVPTDTPETQFQRQRHGVGANNFGTPEFYFRGQIAMVRVHMGVVPVNEMNIFRIPGDIDLDGDVDVDDFDILSANWNATEDATVGQRVTFANGDLDGDGDVDMDDFVIVALNFGNVAPGGGDEVLGGLPEPGMCALIAAGLIAAAVRRR